MGKGGTFNRHACIKALKKIGFWRKKTRRGSHDKYVAPEQYLQDNNSRQPPFIMIPRSRVLHCQYEILKELKNLGGEELVKKFKDLL